MNDGVRGAIGRLLRRLRTERGVSLVKVEELTAKAGTRVPRSRLSMLERGDAPVQLDDVQVLCRVYGMDLVDLLVEALAAPPTGFPAGDLPPEELCSNAERLLDDGQALEADWVFDEAGHRSNPEGRELLARAFIGASIAYQRSGATGLAVRRIEQALDVLQGDSRIRIQALARYAFLLSESGATGRACDQLELALARMSDRSDRRLSAFVTGNQAIVLFAAERYAEALAQARKAARTYRICGSAANASRQLMLAARCELRLGHRDRAVRLARDGAALAEESGQRDCRAWSLIVLGEVLLATGRHDEAEAAARAATDLLDHSGLAVWKNRTYGLREEIARAAGRTREAARWRRRQQATFSWEPPPSPERGRQARRPS